MPAAVVNKPDELATLEVAIGDFSASQSFDLRCDYVGLTRINDPESESERKSLHLMLRAVVSKIAADEVMDGLLGRIEQLLDAMGLEHQRSGNALEVRLPGSDRYLQVAAAENNSSDTSLRIVSATMNVTRVLVAVFEAHQRHDGTVQVPICLWPFMDGVEVIARN